MRTPPGHGSDHGVSTSQAASYEVAVDILRALIGEAANRIDQARTHPEVSQSQVQSWQQRQRQWSEQLRNLRPQDTSMVRSVLNEQGRVLQSLREGKQ